MVQVAATIAQAASTAFPPFLRISIPASVAGLLLVEMEKAFALSGSSKKEILSSRYTPVPGFGTKATD